MIICQDYGHILLRGKRSKRPLIAYIEDNISYKKNVVL